MKANLKTISIIFLALVAGFIISCQNDEGLDSNGKGTVKILLTDAPFPSDQVAEANITIDKIEINKTGDSAQFIVLSEAEMTFNLLDLRNGITTELAEVELEDGTYNQIRMHIVDANIVLNDEASSVFNLKIPGGTSSGLKIIIKNGLVVADGSLSSVLLDFDVSQSFIVQGNPKTKAGIKGFIFKPVVRAVVEAETGSIEGNVSVGDSIDIAGAVVEIFQGQDLVTSAISEANGYFAGIGLPEGEYKVKCNVEGYAAFEAEDIPVVANEATTLDILLQPTE
jgi:hypothetical protein